MTDPIRTGQGRDDADLDRHIKSMLLGIALVGTVLLVGIVATCCAA